MFLEEEDQADCRGSSGASSGDGDAARLKDKASGGCWSERLNAFGRRGAFLLRFDRNPDVILSPSGKVNSALEEEMGDLLSGDRFLGPGLFDFRAEEDRDERENMTKKKKKRINK